ncbi:Ubiquitin conjugation factor E4 A [Coemansia asiatica]|nr:Ubiquitin conjugation factor E4 A [Coemansia asiatica]
MGFMAESFVKPPIEIILSFIHPISLAAILINPRIRQHSAKSITLFIWNERFSKWNFIGKLFWSVQDTAGPQGLCNRELHPQTVSSIAISKGSKLCCDPGISQQQWHPIEPTRAMHSVSQIKIRIGAMHQAHTLGLGAIEIWAQPSQWMPPEKRNAAWEYISKELETPSTLAGPSLSSSHVDSKLSNMGFENVPSDFIDVITQSLINDPVILPCGARCDRTTVARHLETSKTDPFTGLPMILDQVKPDLDLQQRINSWKRAH